MFYKFVIFKKKIPTLCFGILVIKGISDFLYPIGVVKSRYIQSFPSILNIVKDQLF